MTPAPESTAPSGDEARARELLESIAEGKYVDYAPRRRVVAKWIAKFRAEAYEQAARVADGLERRAEFDAEQWRHGGGLIGEQLAVSTATAARDIASRIRALGSP